MTSFRRSDGFVTREFEDETVIVPVRAGVANLEAIFTMNAVGSTIWRGIDGRTTVAEIVQTIVREFNVTEGEAGADVAAFVELLKTKGLVTSAEARE